MLNYPLLQQYFLGKVGFSQTINPCVPKIHPTLLYTQVAVQGVAKELLKNETIYECIEELTEAPEIIAKIPFWNSGDTYEIGDRVKFTTGSNTFVYVSLQNSNTNQTPNWDSAYWETNLSAYLREVHKQSIATCLNSTVVENNNEKHVPTVVSFHTVFERRTQSIADQYQANSFVGVSISLANMRNLQFVVNQIGLQVSDAQTIRFYVYSQSNNTPLTYFDISIRVGDINNFVWKDVRDVLTNEPLVLSYFADNSDVGGLYYIGFYRDEVIGTVNIWDTYYLNFPHSNGSAVRPIIANATAKPNLPNVGYYGWETVSNFETPFNLKVSTSLDYTVNVKEASQQFYNAIQLQIAVDLLNECLNSSRLNRSKSNLEQKISGVLKGQETVIRGLATTTNGLIPRLAALKDNLKINLCYAGSRPFVNNFG